MINWQEVEFRARAVPLLFPPEDRVFAGGYKPETKLDPESFTGPTVFGDPDYSGPIDIVWCWDGREQLVRLDAADLDRISYSDCGNVHFLDEEEKFSDLIRIAKRTLDFLRGFEIPPIHSMTREEFNDIVQWADEEGPTPLNNKRGTSWPATPSETCSTISSSRSPSQRS